MATHARVGTGLVLTKGQGAVVQEWGITNFSYDDGSLPMLDGSNMSSEGYQEMVPGKLKAPGTATIDCQLGDKAPPVRDGQLDLWTVTFNGGVVLSGQATVTSVRINAPVEQIQTFSVTLSFSGQTEIEDAVE